MEEVFYFQQFQVIQDALVFKVNTDGVLLGAWANIDPGHFVLDVGTGTGLIALMLAQRFSDIRLLCIDNLPHAANMASRNLSYSPWSDRMQSICLDFLELRRNGCEPFDHIISNPPYFKQSYLPKSESAKTAKHIDNLTHRALLFESFKLTGPNGKLSMIIPSLTGSELIDFAVLTGWKLNRLCKIQPRSHKPVNRLLLEFHKQQSKPAITDLLLYSDGRQHRSASFEKLVSDFYLKEKRDP